MREKWTGCARSWRYGPGWCVWELQAVSGDLSIGMEEVHNKGGGHPMTLARHVLGRRREPVC